MRIMLSDRMQSIIYINLTCSRGIGPLLVGVLSIDLFSVAPYYLPKVLKKQNLSSHFSE